jgi:hypothetical protein
VNLTIGGKVKQSLNAIDLVPQTDILLGSPTYITTPGAPDDTIEVAVAMPMWAQGLPNSMTFHPENAFLNWSPGNCTGGTLSIYEMIDEQAEDYTLHMIKLTGSSVGAGRVVIPIAMPNVAGVFIVPRNTADKIEITKDDILENNSFGIQGLQATNIFNRLEPGTTNGTIYHNLCPSGELPELVSRKVEVTIEHAGAGTSTVWAACVEFNEARMIEEGVREIAKSTKLAEAIRFQPAIRLAVEPGQKSLATDDFQMQ